MRQIKHGLSVLVQQHLVFWYNDLEDELTTYEANVSATYNLIRVGKYVKITEDRVGEFASKVVSHLLLLGHARVRDLMQAYSTGFNQDVLGYHATSLGSPGRIPSGAKGQHVDGNGDSSATREKVDQTLCELLQLGLIVPVRESTFRSDADNRVEAEKQVGNLAEYKTKSKSKKEKDAMWEAEVTAQIDQWKFGSREEQSEINAFKVGHKRALEDPEEHSAEKRQRISLDASKYALNSTRGNETKLIFDNPLKVWRFSDCVPMKKILTFHRMSLLSVSTMISLRQS